MKKELDGLMYDYISTKDTSVEPEYLLTRIEMLESRVWDLEARLETAEKKVDRE